VRYLPHAILGDMDSIRSDIRLWYESKGVPIYDLNDDSTTDTEKCLIHLYHNYIETHKQNGTSNKSTSPSPSRSPSLSPVCSSPFSFVLIYPAFGGRFDQEIGGLHVMYKYTH